MRRTIEERVAYVPVIAEWVLDERHSNAGWLIRSRPMRFRTGGNCLLVHQVRIRRIQAERAGPRVGGAKLDCRVADARPRVGDYASRELVHHLFGCAKRPHEKIDIPPHVARMQEWRHGPQYVSKGLWAERAGDLPVVAERILDEP